MINLNGITIKLFYNLNGGLSEFYTTNDDI